MATARFKKTFAIRFFSYFAVLLALSSILFEFGPVVLAEINYRKDRLFQVRYAVSDSSVNFKDQSQSPVDNSSQGNVGFGGLNAEADNKITPVSTDYGIVIEKINANSKVVADVDPSDPAQYMEALAVGVAAAKGSTEPGQPGNLYIFAHSTDAPWNVARYNAVFYLLRELDTGDRVIVFYKGRRYNYAVFDKTIVKPSDISFLTNRYDKPVLTLQTCDPPGTVINRLIVRAKLQGS